MDTSYWKAPSFKGDGSLSTFVSTSLTNTDTSWVFIICCFWKIISNDQQTECCVNMLLTQICCIMFNKITYLKIGTQMKAKWSHIAWLPTSVLFFELPFTYSRSFKVLMITWNNIWCHIMRPHWQAIDLPQFPWIVKEQGSII